MATKLRRTAQVDEEWLRTADRELVIRQVQTWMEQARVRELEVAAPWLATRWPDDPLARHYARPWSPAAARISTRPCKPSVEQEYRWLDEHQHEYPGCWVALYDDRLLAADPDPAQVHAAVAAADLEFEPLIYFVRSCSPGSRR